MSNDELTTERLLQLAKATPVPTKMARWQEVPIRPQNRWLRWLPIARPLPALSPLAMGLVSAASAVMLLVAALGIGSAVNQHNSHNGVSNSNPRASAIATTTVVSGSPSVSPAGHGSPPPQATPLPVAKGGTASSANPPGGPPHQNINCISKPSACGYPDATNTGVPAGTALTPVAQAGLPAGTSWDPSQHTLTVTQNGTVISNISIGPDGAIWVEASNVTIKNVSVSSAGYFAIVVRPGFSGTVIEDSALYGEDSGSNSTSYAVQDMGAGTQMLRLNMYNCWACVISSGLLQDSYIHDITANTSATDVSGIGSRTIKIVHNTLLNQLSGEYVIFCSDKNCTVNNNLLAGGGDTVEGGSGSGPGGNSGSNVVITNNRFSPLYFPDCGSIGDIVHFDPSVAGNAWSGNVWDNSNAALPFG